MVFWVEFWTFQNVLVRAGGTGSKRVALVGWLGLINQQSQSSCERFSSVTAFNPDRIVLQEAVSRPWCRDCRTAGSWEFYLGRSIFTASTQRIPYWKYLSAEWSSTRQNPFLAAKGQLYRLLLIYTSRWYSMTQVAENWRGSRTPALVASSAIVWGGYAECFAGFIPLMTLTAEAH